MGYAFKSYKRPRRNRRYSGDLCKRQAVGGKAGLKSRGTGQETDDADDKTNGDTDHKDGDKPYHGSCGRFFADDHEQYGKSDHSGGQQYLAEIDFVAENGI